MSCVKVLIYTYIFSPNGTAYIRSVIFSYSGDLTEKCESGGSNILIELVVIIVPSCSAVARDRLNDNGNVYDG